VVARFQALNDGVYRGHTGWKCQRLRAAFQCREAHFQAPAIWIVLPRITESERVFAVLRPFEGRGERDGRHERARSRICAASCVYGQSLDVHTAYSNQPRRVGFVPRSDFLAELKQRSSSRTRGHRRDPGGVRAGVSRVATADEWKRLVRRQAGFFSFDPDTRRYYMIAVPAPWRDTPGPTWQLVVAMLRNQRRELEERPPAPPAQQRLTFA
jgi:hypothetical protein